MFLSFLNFNKKYFNINVVKHSYNASYSFLRRQSFSSKLSSSLAVGYKPKDVECGRYDKLNFNNKEKVSKSHLPSYTMILPPPNITGELHLGHALTSTVQDVIARWKHFKDHNVVWIPGTDHAGISTQVVVEKTLLKERQLTRHDLGKDKLLEEILKWKETKEQSITNNLKKMGSSLDWSRKYFTLDEKQSKAVTHAFIRLFNDKIIYRGDSLVNWSCTLETAISDIEVENIEINGPTYISVPGYEHKIVFGQITDIAYKFSDNSDEEIIVSTTRPETLLGDVAVAVHPDDSRYAYLKDRIRTLWHPFQKKVIPIIFDSSIDPEFGTGAVKITPAHDKHDFEIAKRHSLPLNLIVIDEKGLISKNFKQFSGIPRFDARNVVLNELKKLNLLRGVKPHSMILPICSRSKDIIEYLTRPQWFINCKEMSENALQAMETGKLVIHPSNYENEWRRWLTDCRDWCISRQLWWGHQIPAYNCLYDGKSEWIAASSYDEAEEKAMKLFGINVKGEIVIQRDQDVLDTWFSSSLLPFSVFDWPNNTNDLNNHYPLDLMETGNDIIFFWVARMVMMGQQLTGKLPFKNILLHGIICDSHGRKMSKSLGNVILPEQIINGSTLKELQDETKKSFTTGILSENEYQKTISSQKQIFPNGIPECGTDSLRFTLCSNNIKNRFINFDVNDCYSNKLFLNKIWQATKYYLLSCDKLNLKTENLINYNMNELNGMDQWILSRLSYTLNKVEESIESYNFHLATSALKEFFYYNFCDVYLETTKSETTEIQCKILGTCLSFGLVYMSSFTPFLSMELLKHLPSNNFNDIKTDTWRNVSIEVDISKILDICHFIRQLKSQNSITKKHNPKVHLLIKSKDVKELVSMYIKHIQVLTICNKIVICSDDETYNATKYVAKSTAKHLCSFGLTSECLDTNMNFDINKKKLEKLELELEKLLLTVSNEGYIKSASEKIKIKHANKIKELKCEIQNIMEI